MKNLKYFVILLFLIAVNIDLQAQNDAFIGSWVAKEPFVIEVHDEKFQFRGFDFLSSEQSPRYEGWLEEAISHEEINEDGARDVLNIFVYRIDKKNSILLLKNIESLVGLEEGTILEFKYQFLKDDEMTLMFHNEVLEFKRLN